MKSIAKKNNYRYQYSVLLFMAGLVALFPVSCNYIMEGGMVTEWTARIAEIAEGLRSGHLYLYPSAGALEASGISINGMDSNLWFWLPGLLYRLTGNLTLAYRIYMLAIQSATLAASTLMFSRIFSRRETDTPVFFGVLLYMTCPYRIYVCYDLADLSQAAAWMLLPVYMWAVLGILSKEGNKPRNLVTAALTLAGIGYADVIFFLTAAGITMLAGLAKRTFRIFIAVAGGGILFLPGLYRLARYLFLDDFQEMNLPLKSIMADGYHLGSYFSSYAFRSGQPGMGLGMLACLLAGAWLVFVRNDKPSGKCKAATAAAAFFVLLSFSLFPWDYLQRMGGWALKLVSLINTPAVFWGMANLFLCVPAASAMNRIRQHENKLLASAIPLMVILACYGLCVYQCNTLTYARLPLNPL